VLQACWGRLTWPPRSGGAQLLSCGCHRWDLQPGRCWAAHRNSQFSPKTTQSLVELSQPLLLGPPLSVTTVRETTAHWHELDCLGLVLVLKHCLTVNANTKCNKGTASAKPTRDIPPADYHHRERRIKHGKPQCTFPFLAPLRGSH